MPLPSSFADFLGNTPVVENLRAAIAAGRLPHALVLAGSRGSGKYTLALLLTMALECELQPREAAADGTARRELAGFCGRCRNCTRIAQAAALDTLIDEAVAAREEMRETDRKDTRILIQTHPDVLIVPPDPPQLLLKLGQIRTVIARAQYLPTEAPAKVFLLTSSAFMKEAANSLLKLLEEPPAYVHLLLLTENPGELLPTIRSRCAFARLGALPPSEITDLLATRRPEWSRTDRELIARLSEGAAGRALGFDLDVYTRARADALTLLAGLEHSNDHSTLFRTTEAYRAGAEGQQKTAALLRALSSLLEDLLLLQSGAPQRIRNIDRRADLDRLAQTVSFAWIESALRAVDTAYSGMRRNLLRSLSLDALALELESAQG
ncbi:MAG TPA: DNA polymerase III subunit delta' [Acidobacteriaceae bacterium]|jgi:DNA polymerase-3 subunit delta'|nr:DNA polymerase III subunit delta' [Acidobacteriaceae bacterium]